MTNFATIFVLPNSTPFGIIRTFVHTLLTVPDPRVPWGLALNARVHCLMTAFQHFFVDQMSDRREYHVWIFS